MTTHSKLSPSKAHRFFLCAGSVREEAKYPDVSGKAAIAGTHTHTLLEHCLKNNSDVNKMVGITLSDNEGEFKVDADQADRVSFALDYIRSQAHNNILVEQRVDPAFFIGRDDCSGTADVILIGDDFIEVIDYKDGMSPVDAGENLQMMVYALGALPTVNLNAISKIKLTIIQPKLRLKGLDGISSWTTDYPRMMEFAEELKQKAAATDAPDAPNTPGESQCKWCKHKGNCSAFINYSMEGAGLNFENIAQQAADKNPSELSDDVIREIVESAPSVRAMLEAVEKEALSRFESGKTIDGLKMIRTSGRRSWSLPDDEMAERLGKMGVPKDMRYTRKLLSPAQASKLTWTGKKAGQDVEKRLSDRQLKTLESEYIVKSSGSLKVVPESEKGEAVTVDASPMFKPSMIVTGKQCTLIQGF